MGIVAYDDREGEVVREPDELRDEEIVIREKVMLELHVERIARDLPEPACCCARPLPVPREETPGELPVPAAGEDDP